ncbi:hypothetical protein EZV62_010598 [Acer yangbiense]|uniref:Uncharacterized protein n=1 Tax=Acer yangbiense TaxID=1000413 RepID=A0A5C7I3E1_9ROSI|nr:hypothetical protein EZV62_010598 [Acer yangbiense]
MANNDNGGLPAGGGNHSLEELRISHTILGRKVDSILNDLRRTIDTLRVVTENLRIRENRAPPVHRAYVSPMGACGQRRARRHVQLAPPEFSESDEGGIRHRRYCGRDSSTDEEVEQWILEEPRGTHCSKIYVDLVDKVRRDVKEDHSLPQGTSQIPTRVLFEPSHPSPYAASTDSNQASESVPTTQNFAPTVEVPIWNGDYGIPDSFIGEQQETADVNDFDSTDDDSSSEYDSDEEGQGSGHNQGQIGAHVQCNPYNVVPPHWVIPGADQYSINSPSSEVSTLNAGAFYKGQIFHTKKNLKDEFGKYALRKNFNPITKRSTQY